MKKVFFFLLTLVSIQFTFSQSVKKTMKRLPDTGQNGDYTPTLGEDADYNFNTPFYSLNGNGTTTDTITGLMWQKTDGGEMTIENAAIYCDTLTLGGYTDWRLPNSHEAFSILNQSRVNPAIDTNYFTKTIADYWWTSQRQVGDSTKVWCANAGGGIGNKPKSETISAGGNKRYHVRAVRDVTPPPAVNHFTDNGDGTVTDNLTGLMWIKVLSTDTANWEQALIRAEASTLASYTDWRLPNIKELFSINDESLTSSSINPAYFTISGRVNIWSSSTLSNQTTQAWYVDTRYGITTYLPKTRSLYMLFVRGNGTTTPTPPPTNINFNIILGRPTDTSITASVLFDQNAEIYLTYGTQSGVYTGTTSTITTTNGITEEVDMRNLLPNTKYYYQLRYRTPGGTFFTNSNEYTFQTQRPTGSTFTFTVEADEHLYDIKGVKSLYNIALNNQAADKPDFMLSLGDIFGDDHTYLDTVRFPVRITEPEVDALHKDYRPILGNICHSIPFYVCLGNHEGENNFYLNKTFPNNLAIWGTKWRKSYYPNPKPNSFYSGSIDTLYNRYHGTGPTENYFSWTWGDALFVVLDVYRYQNDTTDKPTNWDWTLGRTQYNWLRSTLENSTSKYKFVFAHHIRGQGRGGVTNAKLFEWGGLQNLNNGQYTFDTYRPGWGKPIHQLFKDNHVNIFFQGHDHVFAHEVLDSVTYQAVPMPSDSTYGLGFIANAGAYVSDTVDGSGHIRVTVSPTCVKVDYVKAYLPADTLSGAHHNREIGFSYTIGSCAVTPCTSFTYGAWSACNNGIQTRTYTANPSGCTGTPPADSIQRTCTTPPVTLTVTRAELLGQPTNNSVALNMFFSDSVEMRVRYGTVSGTYTNNTSWQTFAGAVPAVINITGLQADTKYYYSVSYRKPGTITVTNRSEYSFHTQRTPGSSFSFVVQADPHVDEQSDSLLYSLCLKNQLEDNPDFMIDLGDFLMTDKLKRLSVPAIIPRDTITYRCNVLRAYYEKISHSVPLFIALGNHEGESGWNITQTNPVNNIANWNTIDRKKYFLNPYPDNFYSGDTASYANVGQRAAYYSWKWGDALFIVIDPYWSTKTKPDSLNGWRWTLGKDQYDWLRRTLESDSTSKFKFVFAHQMVGGDPDGRGGVEFAKRYEWGGYNIDDTTYTFGTNRPGWYKPLKDLFFENKVNVFFHGHDHFYGKQERDCLVYQETPQPSHPNPSNTDNVSYAASYGYHEGIIQASSGHLRITVDSNRVKVDYVRTYLPANEDATHHNKDVSATYYITASNNCYSNPDTCNISLTETHNNPTSASATNGSITVTASPVGINTYSINGAPFVSSNVFNNLDTGFYYIVVKNSTGCTSAPITITLTPPSPNPCLFTYGVWSACNNGTQTRTYSANPSGCTGTPPSDSLTRSCGVVIPGCNITLTETHHYPTTPTANNGSITINATPSSSSLSYSIDGIHFQSDNTFDSLIAEVYQIIVKDNNCQSAPMVVNLNPFTPVVSPILYNTTAVNDLVFPNPFSTSVQIQFTQEKADNLYIYIYNDRGQLIRKFFNGQYVDRGRYVVYWDGTSEGGAPMSNGVYIYSIKIGSQLVKSGKLVLMK